jgi:hypothetical protein
MIAQIEEGRPEYLVFVNHPLSWDTRMNFRRAADAAVMAWANSFEDRFYEPVGLVILKNEPEYFWGRNVPWPFPGLSISILKRK